MLFRSLYRAKRDAGHARSTGRHSSLRAHSEHRAHRAPPAASPPRLPALLQDPLLPAPLRQRESRPRPASPPAHRLSPTRVSAPPPSKCCPAAWPTLGHSRTFCDLVAAPRAYNLAGHRARARPGRWGWYRCAGGSWLAARIQGHVVWERFLCALAGFVAQLPRRDNIHRSDIYLARALSTAMQGGRGWVKIRGGRRDGSEVTRVGGGWECAVVHP